MRILMNMIGVYDSERNELVGQHEIDEKHSRQAIRHLAKKQGVSSIKLVQLILASSFVPSPSSALSFDLREMAVEAQSVIEGDFGMSLFTWLFGNAGYVINYALMQLCYLIGQVDAYFRGPMMLIGMLAVLCFLIGLTFRLVYGVGNFSILSRAFSLSGDVITCLASPLLYKWIDVRISWLQGEHRRLIKLKNKYAILDVQNRMIALRESKRVLDGIVYGFYDAESPSEKFRRYQNSRIEDCSDPEYWQEINHLNLSSDDETSSESHETAHREMEDARQRALHAAHEALEHAEAHSDFERMEECNRRIDELTML